MIKILLLKIKSIIDFAFGFLTGFIVYIKNNLDIFLEFLKHTKYSFFYIPLFLGFLGFLETFGIIGLFIPLEIVTVTTLAFMKDNLSIFVFSVIVLSLGIFLGLLAGYFVGKYFLETIMKKIGKKFPKLDNWFVEVENYMQKYHFIAFPIIINIAYIRPIFALYLGSRNYDFRKYFFGIILSTLAYVIPRAIIGFLFGMIGNIVLRYLEIGYKYLLYFCLALIAIAFVFDIILGIKNYLFSSKDGNKTKDKKED